MNLSIRGKLIVGALLILLLIVSVLTFVLARSAATMLEKESGNQLSQLLEQSTVILSNFLQARAANLELWASEPLVHSMANDPALGAIFSLGLRDYFDNHSLQEPWIENIVLLKDEQVVYAHVDSPLFSDGDSSAAQRDSFRQLLTLPPEVTAAFKLDVQAEDDAAASGQQGVIAMKRQLLDETGPAPGAFVVLLLNLDKIQQMLFGQTKAGRNGFLALAARLRWPAGVPAWVPSQPPDGQPERRDFFTAHQQQLLFADAPQRFLSIVLDHRKLAATPLAVVGVAALRDVRGPVQQLLYFAISCGLLAVGIGIVSIFFFAGRLTAPIRELTSKAHEFASNRLGDDLARPVLPLTDAAPQAGAQANALTFERIDSRDEVGELSSVFQQLDQRTAELEQANELLGQRNRDLDEAMQTLQQTQDALVINLKRLERELAAARKLQLSMVPNAFPDVTPAQPVDIYAMIEPAREVGGDMYDFFYVDDNTFCFIVGDVSDKGTSAALFMARTRSLIRFALEQWRESTGAVPDAGQIMQAVNRELCQNNKTRMFVTLFLGLLDIRKGVVEYANGGHVRPYRLGVQSAIDAVGDSRPDVPLGVQQHGEYRNKRLSLRASEMLFLYTDGISEAMNLAGQFYSSERLQTELATLRAPSSKDAIIAVKQQVDKFVGDAPRFDDMTLLALRWCPQQRPL